MNNISLKNKDRFYCWEILKNSENFQKRSQEKMPSWVILRNFHLWRHCFTQFLVLLSLEVCKVGMCVGMQVCVWIIPTGYASMQVWKCSTGTKIDSPRSAFLSDLVHRAILCIMRSGTMTDWCPMDIFYPTRWQWQIHLVGSCQYILVWLVMCMNMANIIWRWAQ